MTPQEELHDRCHETETGTVLVYSDEMPVPLCVFALNRRLGVLLFPYYPMLKSQPGALDMIRSGKWFWKCGSEALWHG